MSHLPTEIQADAGRVLSALQGGYAAVTVRSKETGQHCKVIISGKKYAPPGSGSKFVSRAKREGRVGLGSGADLLEVRDPDREYPENYVGRLYTNEGEWRSGRDADPLRAWTAEKVLSYARGGYDLSAVADVFLATKCAVCGKKLEDPTSIERGIGPECYGRQTGSKNAPHAKPAPAHEAAGQAFLTGAQDVTGGTGFSVDPAIPDAEAAEQRMQEMEAAGDRAQTAREEAAKWAAKAELEKAPPSIQTALEALRKAKGPTGSGGKTSPPCMGCGKPEDTHVAGECVR